MNNSFPRNVKYLQHSQYENVKDLFNLEDYMLRLSVVFAMDLIIKKFIYFMFILRQKESYSKDDYL